MAKVMEGQRQTTGRSTAPNLYGHPLAGLYWEKHCHDRLKNLGWEPVIILNAAGLKVGEIVAKARMNGLNIEDSIQASVDYGIGQDFEGGFMNFNLS